jgi:membrane-bound metal-dependent hydrolase YbcI (DUF457 family)
MKEFSVEFNYPFYQLACNPRVNLMFAIGHFALGYLFGKGSAKALKTSLSVPLMLAISVLPDIDLFLQQANSNLFMHRGATHSLVTLTVLLIPFLIVYRKRAIPYYAVLLSHILIGDFFTGGIEIFWPLTQDWVGNFLVGVGTLADAVAELSLFALVIPIMFKAGDLRSLLQPKKINLVLVMSFLAVLGPVAAIGSHWGGSLPLLLLAPSLFWLVIFAYSILLGLGLNFKSMSKR